MVMLIQSPVASARKVAGQMDEFLAAVPSQLDREQFARHQAALISEILQPDKNLWERAEFYWQSIALKQQGFDARQLLAEAVESFSLETWTAYFERVFRAQPRSLKVVAPGRWEQLPKGRFHRFDSAGSIKADHETYLVD